MKCIEVHKEIDQKPDHLTCEMPQVLRQPEYRTEEPDENLDKLLTTRSILSNPSIQNLGLSSMAIEAIWGKMDRWKAEDLIMGIIEMDKIAMEEQEKLHETKDPKKMEFEQ